MRLSIGLVLLLCCCATGLCHAATVTVYSDAALFVAAVGPTTTIDYDASGFVQESTVFEVPGGVLDDTLTDTLLISPIDFGPFSLIVGGLNNTIDDTFFRTNQNLTTLVSRIPNQAANDGILSLGFFTGEHQSFGFSFDTPITAFGFTLFSQEDPLNGVFNFTGGATANAAVLAGGATLNSFVGFQFDEAVSSFTLTSPQNMTFFAGNPLVTTPTAVPEPGSLAMLAIGGLVAAGRVRRRKLTTSV